MDEQTDANTAGDGPYRGRHTRPGEGDGAPSGADDAATQVPGVPSGWPGEDDMPAPRPTSPTSGAASEAAARAAYADNPRPPVDTPAPEADDLHAQFEAETQGAPIEEASAADRVDAPADTASSDEGLNADAQLAAERLADLQSLQAEYVNYKRRVDRDRDAAKTAGITTVVESMIPVLDEIELARQHGDLESGPFVKIAEKLETVLTKHGIERYGQAGDTFDPAVHEAIMHTQAELAPGTTETTVVQVMQPGYRIGDRVVRAALVAVADPQ